ncbi:MAG: flagellar basal body rod protein FlgC [Alicyclobacillus sp.]|nr:flagellar basal body rod protein FlgC [Alicyclobacillus sp.]
MTGLGGALAISASGLAAQRLRMDVISNNIANADTTRTAAGGPYRREEVVLQAVPLNSFTDALNSAVAQGTPFTAGAGGVQVAAIVQDPSAFRLQYDPSNPDAVGGYVELPNVDLTTELTDMMEASRSYDADATAFDAAKQMFTDALTIGK